MSEGRAGARGILALAAVVIVVAGFKMSADLMLPFLLASFLAILTAPFVLWLQKHRWPAWVAVLLVVVLTIAALFGLAILVAISFDGFDEAFEGYKHTFADLVTQTSAALARLGVELPSTSFVSVLQPERLLELANTAWSQAVMTVKNTALVILIMVFALLEAATFPRRMRAAMHSPGSDLGGVAKVMREIQRYLGIKTIMSVLTGALLYLWNWTLGVDFPLLWGIVAFGLNYVPTVGSILAAIPPMLVAVVQPGLGWQFSLGLGAGYAIINVLIGNIMEPQFMGRSLGLSPLAIFLSLVFWGWLWGPVGMLLSVPLTVILKLLLEQSTDSKWLAVLIEAPPAATHARAGEAGPPPSASESLVAAVRKAWSSEDNDEP